MRFRMISLNNDFFFSFYVIEKQSYVSTTSVRPKKFTRPELNDWGKDDFFQKTYEAFDVHEFNFIDMAVHVCFLALANCGYF